MNSNIDYKKFLLESLNSPNMYYYSQEEKYAYVKLENERRKCFQNRYYLAKKFNTVIGTMSSYPLINNNSIVGMSESNMEWTYNDYIKEKNYFDFTLELGYTSRKIQDAVEMISAAGLFGYAYYNAILNLSNGNPSNLEEYGYPYPSNNEVMYQYGRLLYRLKFKYNCKIKKSIERFIVYKKIGKEI